jgi:predicted dehydrogenase
LDPILSVLGGFKDIQAVFKTQGKTVPLFDATGTVLDPAYKATAPEYILIQGVLESGAAESINLRCTPATVNEVGFRWIVSGTEGELEFTSPNNHIQSHLSESKLFLKKWQGATEEVSYQCDEPAHVSSLPDHVINTGRLYESFATGDEEGYASFEAARNVQNLIERVKEVAIWAS